MWKTSSRGSAVARVIGTRALLGAGLLLTSALVWLAGSSVTEAQSPTSGIANCTANVAEPSGASCTYVGNTGVCSTVGNVQTCTLPNSSDGLASALSCSPDAGDPAGFSCTGSQGDAFCTINGTIAGGDYRYVCFTPAANMALLPSSLDFGNQLVGTTSTTRTFNILNPGGINLRLSGITASGDFAQTNDCPAVLPSGISCTVTVTFSPTAAGTRTGSVQIASNAANHLSNVALTGVGEAPLPTIAVAPGSLSFADQNVGTTSASQTVTLTNTGTAPLVYTTIQTSGDFGQTNNCPLPALPVGASCSVNVAFTPTATGNRAGTLLIASNATNGDQNVSLSGTGIVPTAPTISVAPGSVAFGSVLIGQSSSAQVVTITNTGTAPLVYTNIQAFGDFSQTNNCPLPTLPVGASCSVNVTFTPTAAGNRVGNLLIASNATNGDQNVPLSGTGAAPTSGVNVTPGSLTFGSQLIGTTSAIQTITVQSTGTAPLGISSIAASGDFAQSHNCPASLATGASCTISVTFTPTAAGARSGQVTVATDAGNANVALAGTGQAAAVPGVSISPNALTFNDQLLGTTSTALTVTVQSTGTAALTLNSITANGDFAQSHNCPASLASGASCTVSVTFTPSVPGSRSGLLTVSTNAGDQTASLAGTGQNAPTPAVSLTPASLMFTGQVVNSTSAAQSITVQSTGTAALAITSIAANGDFAQTNNCPATLAVGAQCTIDVTFTPASVGPRAGQITVSTNAGSPTVALSGTGQAVSAPAVAVSPSSLVFTGQIVGTTSAVQTISVQSTGTAALPVTSIVAAGDFAQTNNCPASLPAGASCTVSVTFTPTATGARSGSVTANTGAGNPVVMLSGTGQAVVSPGVAVAPASIDFGTQLVNVTSSARTITIQSTGSAPLAITSIGASGDYAQTNTCPANLAVGASCTVSVTFTPSTTGVRAGQVAINTNAGNSSVALTGTGVAAQPQLSVSPASLTFGPQYYGTTSATQTLTLTNTGGAPLTISAIGPRFLPDFGVDVAGCLAVIPPGMSCQATVNFTPYALGARNDQLRINSNVAGGTTDVSLGGTGSNTINGYTFPGANSKGYRDPDVVGPPRSQCNPETGKCEVIGSFCLIAPEMCAPAFNGGGGRLSNRFVPQIVPADPILPVCPDPESESSAPTQQPESLVAALYDIGSNVVPTDILAAGDPINVGSGNKYHFQLDYASSGDRPLVLSRVYNSQPGSFGLEPFGVGWSSGWSRRLLISPTAITALRPDGKELRFELVAGEWRELTNNRSALRVTATGWVISTRYGSAETYNAAGRLIQATSADGQNYTIEYDASGNLAKVTAPYGRFIRFVVDTKGRITKAIDPAGGEIHYEYDAFSRLVKVTYPDARTREYRYQHPTLKFALTGIVDGVGTLYMSAQYDAQGRAVQTEFAGGVGRVTVAYGADGTATVTDADGTTWRRTFATINGEVVGASTQAICSTCGSFQLSEAYDSAARLVQSTDARGIVTEYQYDAQSNVSQVIEARGLADERKALYSWDSGRKLLQASFAGDTRVTRFTYDSAGRLARSALEAGVQSRATNYGYDALGRLVSIDEPRLDVTDTTAITYDGASNVATMTNAAGQVVRYLDYDAHGRPGRIRYGNNTERTLTYDARGRVLSDSFQGRSTVNTYDSNGLISRTLKPDGTSIVYRYDAAQRLIGTDASNGESVRYTLDSSARTIRTETFDAQGVLATTASSTFDGLGRQTQSINAQGQITRYTYDATGNKTSVIDALGNATQFEYDALNRPVLIKDPLNGRVRATRTVHDEIASVTDPINNTTTYNRNGLGDNTVVLSQDAGTTTRTFDAAGNPLTNTDARGKTSTYTYDALGRVTRVVYSDSTPQTTYTYDVAANGVGRIASITDPSGTTTFTYDSQGRVASKTQVVNGLARTVGYTRDSIGRVTGMTYPSGKVLAVTYDANGDITRLAIDGQTVISEIEYFPFGAPEAWKFGNGKQYGRLIDKDGRINRYTTPQGTKVINFDAAGRIVGISDTASMGVSTYGYDGNGRLVSFSGSTNLGNETRSYSYDANGNRLTASINGTAAANTQSFTYITGSNKLAEVRQGNTPGSTLIRGNSYDAMGSLVADGVGKTYTYDARGRLVQANTAASGSNPAMSTQYRINAQGLRVSKSNSSETKHFVYDDAGRMLGEYDGSGNAIQELVWLGNTPVAVVGAVPQSCPANASIGGSNFTSFAANEGLFLQPANGGKFEWRVGGDTQSTSGSAGNTLDVTAGKAYRFVYTVNTQGQGNLKLYDGATLKADINYTGANKIDLGNSIRIQLRKTNGNGSGDMTVIITSVNGQAINRTLSSNDTGTPPFDLTISGSSLQTSLTVEGTAKLDFNGNGTASIKWEMMINAGNATCASSSTTGAGNIAANIGYIWTDHLNTPRAITNAANDVVWKWDSAPFGDTPANDKPTATLPAFTFNHRFPGQYFDKETGLHQNWHRDYDPALGRYVQFDPIGLRAGSNPFEYAGSAPTIYYDPTGLIAIVTCTRCASGSGQHACVVTEDDKVTFAFSANTSGTNTRQLDSGDYELTEGKGGSFANISNIGKPGSVLRPDGTVSTGVQIHNTDITRDSRGCIIPSDGSPGASKDVVEKVVQAIRRNKDRGGSILRIVVNGAC
jgi:RHS repeat-associated protein